MKKIQSVNRKDRPREKLSRYGATALRDEELVAILLGSGNRRVGVHLLAKRVLSELNRKNGDLRIEDLLGIEGIGFAKATMLLAALEFVGRRIRPKGVKITGASDVVPLLTHWAGRPQEHFISLTLNGANEVIQTRVVTIGTANASQIHPREVFSDVITDRSCAVIVAHNHPSGDLTPSDADKEVTARLIESGKILGIRVLDHIIFSERGYMSFKEAGLM